MTSKETARVRRLVERGFDLVQKSRFPEALDVFDSVRELAVEWNDKRLLDKADTNRSMVLLEMGEYARASSGLKEIILRSSDPKTICGASYNLSISLRRQGHYQKACFYARLATEKSRAIDDSNWIARCHNLMGNLHLVQSRLAPALKEYRKALAIRLKEKRPNSFAIGILKDNIGYVQLLLGRYDDGIKDILEALKHAEEVGNTRSVCECHHDLAFGYMQTRSLEEAASHGERALEMAERLGCKEIVKNCYYILGEINHLKGDMERRDHYFYKLQSLHPQLPFLRDFLCAFDVSNIIALRFPQ